MTVLGRVDIPDSEERPWGLTAREFQVMGMATLPGPPSDDEIGSALGCSGNTARLHGYNARMKMGGVSRGQAIVMMRQYLDGDRKARAKMRRSQNPGQMGMLDRPLRDARVSRRVRRVDQDTTLGLIEA